MLRHLSLFTGGAGGFDFAAELMGWFNIAHVEIDEDCRAILKNNFPYAESYADIRQFDGKKFAGAIDIVSGGFPCQPFSTSGKRAGTNDSRFLFPEMLRVIREVKPRWVVAENVLGLVSQDGGMVLEQVLASLEAEGYQVQTYNIPACAVGAPHERQRVWIVAYSDSYGRYTQKHKREYNSHQERNIATSSRGRAVQQGNKHDDGTRTNASSKFIQGLMRPWEWWIRYSDASRGTTSNPTRERFKGRLLQSYARHNIRPLEGEWVQVAAEFCRVDDGVSTRMDRIQKSKERKARIKMLGNAIVPQVALQFFKTIEAFENKYGA